MADKIIDVPGHGEVGYEHLPIVDPSIVKTPSVMKVSATVENNPQPLRTLRPFAGACLQIPALLREEAQIVLQALFSCFEKQKEVKEGLVGDLIWGFGACGIPPELSVVGLRELDRQGYIRFQAPDNEFVHMESSKIEKAWVKYEPKLLNMVYEV